jgi:hypothetical protein
VAIKQQAIERGAIPATVILEVPGLSLRPLTRPQRQMRKFTPSAGDA